MDDKLPHKVHKINEIVACICFEVQLNNYLLQLQKDKSKKGLQ